MPEPVDPKRRRRKAISPNADRETTQGPRVPPPLADRLIDKYEAMKITGASYVTLWTWMRAWRFPRSRKVGGRSMWLFSEVQNWLDHLPVQPLKGDADTDG